MATWRSFEDFVKPSSPKAASNYWMKASTLSVAPKAVIANGPFEKWGIDAMGPLPRTANGKLYILVAIDYMTRWVEVQSVAKVNEKTVSKFVYTHICCRFGTPLEIVSDNGPGFRRGLLTEVCEELKISHRHSTPYYPQSNGLVEKANEIIAGIIRKMVESKPKRWDNFLDGAIWAYRTTYRDATQFTPFHLVYGQEALQPIELNIPTIKLTGRQEQSNDEAWIDRLLNLVELEWKREAAYHCYKKKALQLKDKLNEGIKDKEIKEKSLVLRYNNALDNRFDAKFERRWEGPFIVKKAFTGGYYQLMDLNGKEHPRKVNGYRLKPYLSRILPAVFITKQVSKKTKKVKELKEKLAQAKAKLHIQKENTHKLLKDKEKEMGSQTHTDQPSTTKTHIHIQLFDMPSFPDQSGTPQQEEDEQRPARGALDVRADLTQSIEDMPKGPAKEFMLYKIKVMNSAELAFLHSAELAFLQPEEQVKDIGHEMLPFPLMRHEANLWKEKMRLVLDKNDEGGYEGITLTIEEAQALNRLCKKEGDPKRQEPQDKQNVEEEEENLECIQMDSSLPSLKSPSTPASLAPQSPLKSPPPPPSPKDDQPPKVVSPQAPPQAPPSEGLTKEPATTVEDKKVMVDLSKEKDQKVEISEKTLETKEGTPDLADDTQLLSGEILESKRQGSL
ncbi:hypothetical protein L7F22_055302 [Adiantum nelumboides]|nr:hypothetical protein [Adiantum nelumboides]